MSVRVAPAPDPLLIAEVESALAGLPYEVLLCRELGHRWDTGGEAAVVPYLTGMRGWREDLAKAKRLVLRVFTCERCTTVRRDESDWVTGKTAYRKYKYPPEYRVPGVYIYRREARRERFDRDLGTLRRIKSARKKEVE